MRKNIFKLIAIILCFSMINIPVFPVTADVSLISVEEDFTKYSSLSDIPYFVYEENEHSTIKLDSEKGLVIEQVKSTPLIEGALNKKAAPTIAHIIEGTFNNDAEKRTSYRINRYSGKYKMTVDFEVLSDKHTEQVEGVTISSPYYLWKFGTVSNPSEMETSITDKMQLRVYSASTVAYSSGTVKLETSDTLRFTSGEAHQLVMDVDTDTKAVSVNIDGYKTPASGEIRSSGYINSISISGMERMLTGSNFVIKKIKMEQTEADAATTAALTALDAISELSATPFEVTEDITLPSSANIEWSSSDESVVDLTGKVTRGTEDKDVTLTATYTNGNTVLYKDFVLTVKADAGDDTPSQNEGLICVEEDFTQYSSLTEIPNFVYDENEHTSISAVKGTGLVIEQVKSTPVSGETFNKAKSSIIAHMVEGVFDKNADERSSYRIDRYSGDYKITMDFELLCGKYTEPVDGISITNPYYGLGFSGAASSSALSTSLKDRLSLRMYSTSTVAYDPSSKLATANTVRYTDGEPHQLVVDINTNTKAVSVNIDNYKTPASGSIVKDGYINSFVLYAMERMIVGSKFVIKNIKIEQTKADADTTAALTALKAVAAPATDPNAVTEDVTLGTYDSIKWSTSDENIISETGKVTRGLEDKDVTLTATYTNGNTVLYKDFVLTVKALTDLEIATADVKAINLNIGDSVTSDIAIPLTGEMGTAFTWVSSHPEIITNDGKVTRGEEDTTVTLTVTGTYGEKSYPRTFTVFVPSKDVVVEPPVYSDLIYVEEDFTKYSSVDEIPYFVYGKTTHATVEAVKGKGLVITQTKSTPFADDAVNKEQVPNISHVIEGIFNEDAKNRTAYAINRYGGKYRMTVDFEVDYDVYDEETDGFTVSSPYYPFYFGTTAEPSTLTSTITNFYALYMRVKKTSVTAYGAVSSDAFTPSSVKYTEGVPHQMVVEFDTLTKKTTVNVDNNNNPAEGYLKKPGYLNTFYIAGMERMKVGSYFLIKKISLQQLEEDENLTKALNALAKLPEKLSDDPFAVTDNIILPTDNDKIKWTTSDESVITANGKVNRWYADRDVVLTATYTDNDTVLAKKYTLTVKALDSYFTTEIMNKVGKELADVVIVGDLNKGSVSVSDNGITVTKLTGGTGSDAEDLPVFFADYRLFGETTAYNDDTKSSLSTAGYSGIYDVGFNVTPAVSGNKPVYISLGNKYNGFTEILALVINKDSLSISHEKGVYNVVEEATSGKTYKITFRVDTNQKKVWVYVNDELAGSFFEFSKIELMDALRVVIDENNAANDSIVINNIMVTEISKNILESIQPLVNALNRLTVNDVTETPDTVESIKALPAVIGDYEITWSSNSELINVEKGTVYHGDKSETVVVSATIGKDGVYAKKDFYLFVRGAATEGEKLDYYISDLAETITKQNANDIRYDINLPAVHNGLTINWTSSKPEIIDVNGKINKSVVITKPTEVVLTANVTLDGITYPRTFTYKVSPRTYENVIYTGNGAPEAITVNGVDNVAVACTNVTKIKFKQAGNGTITLSDASGNKVVEVNISDNLYNISYGDTSTVNYPIVTDETVELDVMIMPDIDRVAIWADGMMIVDFGETLSEVSDLSSITVVGGVEVTETKITTDEYGILDINVANSGYFDVFKDYVVKGDVTLVKDTVIPADVVWASSNQTLLNDVTGEVKIPDEFEFVDVTLTLTSTKDANVKRVITRKIAVACAEGKNLAKGAKVNSNAPAKSGYNASNMTDGDFDTAYGTSYANRTPVITIDLGKKAYVNALYVNEDFAEYDKSLKAYTVAYSNDGSNWTTVKTDTVTGTESALINFESVYARYFSFTVNECEQNNLYINEIEAYLFADSAELAKLDVELIDLNLGYTVTSNIALPTNGQYGTVFTWASGNPEIISATGVVTKPAENTNVTLTVTGQNGTATYSKSFTVYVSGTNAGGAAPVGGGGGSAGGGGGTGTSQLPGFVETDVKEEETVVPEITESTFADMDTTHWAYENVKKLKELGIVDGDENGNFNPSGKVTREQFLKMLVLATDVNVSSTKTSFADVDENVWYAPYVAAGVNAGLINGITADTFGVGAEIVRQDMAVMIVRILNKHNITVTQTSEVFDDDSSVSDYAKDAVYKVRDAGIIQGYNNKFSPKDSLTRAEAATVIIKMLEILK